MSRGGAEGQLWSEMEFRSLKGLSHIIDKDLRPLYRRRSKGVSFPRGTFLGDPGFS